MSLFEFFFNVILLLDYGFFVLNSADLDEMQQFVVINLGLHCLLMFVSMNGFSNFIILHSALPDFFLALS